MRSIVHRLGCAASRPLVLCLIILALLLFLPGSGAQAASGKPFHIKYAEPSRTAMSWPMYAAGAEGYFKQENLDVEWDIMANPQDLTRALMAGSFPIALMNTMVPMIGQEKGGHVRVVAGIGKDIPYDLIGAKGITSIQQLRGKKVSASSLRSGTTILTERVLAANGLKQGDYSILVVGDSPERFAAIKGGSVSASPMGPPFNLRAIADGFPRLTTYKRYIGAFQWLILMANTDFGKEHPDVVVRFLKAVIRGQQWMANGKNRQKAIEILVHELRMQHPKLAAASYDYLYKDLKGMTLDGGLSPRGMQTAVDLLVQKGQLKRGSTWKQFVNLSYVEKAQRELGLR